MRRVEAALFLGTMGSGLLTGILLLVDAPIVQVDRALCSQYACMFCFFGMVMFRNRNVR